MHVSIVAKCASTHSCFNMPPHVPRKRLRSSPDGQHVNGTSSVTEAARSTPAKKRKPTLYDDLDATATPLSGQSSVSILQHLGEDGSSSSSSSLTSLSDEEFEDVALTNLPSELSEDEQQEEDDDVEFEDVEAPIQASSAVPVVSGDLDLTLNKDTRLSLTNVYGDKRGPSKRERKVRHATHCLHVMSLLWHNAVRNSWLCDAEVQAIMLSHLSPRMWDEVERWRVSSGLVKPPSQQKSKTNARGKRKGRDSRDWAEAAKKLEVGAVDMSHGDPLFRLMQSLVSWWKQRFKITASGLRKWGYMTLERLDRLRKAYVEDFANQARFGERVESLDEFRQCAIRCQGSRDVGAQLFTALLRGLGIEARLVASLQPLGFGWNRLEDADPEKVNATETSGTSRNAAPKSSKKASGRKPAARSVASASPRPSRGTRSNARLEPSSNQDDDLRLEHTDSDDESVIDTESAINTKSASKTATVSFRKYDADLDYPHYWTEALSPVTNKYLSIDAIVKNLIGTNREIVESFEPRGQKADKARQVMAYVVGYSPDGTAKDVTVRYLKRHVMPGRTKGLRLPVEKIPTHNRHGKVKRYENFDWFKTAMSGYCRGPRSHPITEVDEDEEATDLKPAKPEKKEVKDGEETLQYYKQSKEFVLERHLKREEAFKSGVKPVKKFKNKSKGGNVEEEDVYLRSDVVQVKSAETWHKQGRAPVVGEQPLKRVPYRAATINRRREILEAEAATGEKVLQGLFSHEQTDWIIPPPIENGVIPKNEYGCVRLTWQILYIYADHVDLEILICSRSICALKAPFISLIAAWSRSASGSESTTQRQSSASNLVIEWPYL